MRIPELKVKAEGDALDWVFIAVFPHYAMGSGFSSLYLNKVGRDACRRLEEQLVDPGFCEKGGRAHGEELVVFTPIRLVLGEERGMFDPIHMVLGGESVMFTPIRLVRVREACRRAYNKRSQNL